MIIKSRLSILFEFFFAMNTIISSDTEAIGEFVLEIWGNRVYTRIDEYRRNPSIFQKMLFISLT